MSRNPLQTKLISIVEPVCQSAGYELVDLRFAPEQGGWVLRVCIDRPIDANTDITEVPEERVDLHDCENLSRELSAVLDVDDPITHTYSLEVSSPGIDRPLRTPQHYEYFAGSEAKIQMAIGLPTATGERKNFRGILRGVEDRSGSPAAKIEVDGQLFTLPIDDIDHAKLVPDWDAVMRGKSGLGAPPQQKPEKQKKPKSKPKGSDDAGPSRNS
jgi:ribosome maturation factor RimP